MNKIKIFCPWELNIDLEHEKQIELYIDNVPCDEIPENTVRILLLIEPPTFLDLSQQVFNNQDSFNFVLTHNQHVIDNCPKAQLFEHGMSWIKDYDFNKEKEYSVSTLVGFKTISDGHYIRHKLWYKQDRIVTPKKFYLSKHSQGIENFNNNPIIGEGKNQLFDSQFHICIESTKRDNYFTEKLLDALITKTIPIYYGCPNIGNWFNMNGIFMVDNLEDIINICNGLNSETYKNMLPYIEENFLKAQVFSEYMTVSNRLKNKIENLLKNGPTQ